MSHLFLFDVPLRDTDGTASTPYNNFHTALAYNEWLFDCNASQSEMTTSGPFADTVLQDVSPT